MKEAHRECHICRKVLPISAMVKREKLDWGKFIYFCKVCVDKKRKAEESAGDGYFSIKYRHLKGRNDWYDD